MDCQDGTDDECEGLGVHTNTGLGRAGIILEKGFELGGRIG